MGIRDVVAKALGYQLGAPRTPSNLFQMTEMQLPPGWAYQSYLQAYGQVGWLFACVNVIAEAVSRQEWHLYKINREGDRDELFQHDLLNLLNNVNPFQTRQQFMYLGTMYKKLVGEQFWQINLNGRNKPAEMWLVPPAYMNVVPSAENYIDHYEFKRPSMIQPKVFSVEEIIHIMTPNPANPYRGISEAQALTVDIDSERYAARYQQKLFFNDAMPGVVIEYPADGMPSPETRKELVEEWDNRHRGFRNRGKTAFLWGGKVNTVTLTNREMDFAKLRGFSRDAILGAYHIPRSVIGITENVNRANAEAGNYTFAYYVVHPELCAIREAMNKELCPFFGSDLYLDFDNPIPEDITANVNNAEKLFKAKIINRNEARALVEFDELETPDGEEYFVQAGAASPNGAAPKTRVKLALKEGNIELFENEEAKEAYWKRYVDRTEKQEKSLIQILTDIFDKSRNEVVNNITEGHRTSFVNKTEIRNVYIEKVTPILSDTIIEAIEAGMDLIKPRNPHKEISVNARLMALEWLKTRIAWAADEIGETLADSLGNALLDGFNTGESIPQLTDRVKEFFDSPVRAKRIARTETIAASSQGTLEGYRESGVVKKIEFYTAADERTCDYCNNYHQVEFPLGQEMPIPLHPNCRCVYLPVIED